MDWDRVTTWVRELDKKRLALVAALFIGTFAVTALVRWDMDFTYTVAREQVDAGVYGTLGFWFFIVAAPVSAAVRIAGFDMSGFPPFRFS